MQCYDWLVTRLKEQRAEACTYGNELSKPACDGGWVSWKGDISARVGDRRAIFFLLDRSCPGL